MSASASAGREVCAECSSSISGKIVRVLDQSFHPRCIECSQCAKSMTEEGYTTLFTRTGKVICPRCRSWAVKEKGTAVTAGDVEHSFRIESLLPPSNLPWHQQNGPPVKCIACQQLIQGTAVQIDRAKYHPMCVKCDKCNVNLPSGHVKVAGRPFCGACATAAKEARGQKTDYIAGSTIAYSGPSAPSSGAVAAGIRYNQVTREVTTAAPSIASTPSRPPPSAPASATTAAVVPPKSASSSSCAKCGALRPTTGNAFGGRMAFCQGCGAKF